jgi:transcriptional antiterminator
LFEEVAFIAYHFHWSLEDILNLEHGDRHRFIEEISAINKEMNANSGSPSPSRGIPLELWS